MFAVKATYKDETRKINFNDSPSFPSYDQLYYQLFRVFPISPNVILSKLLFSPDSSKPLIRMLLAQEVRNADEYQRATAPLQGRVSSGALLRFTISDSEVSPVFSPSSSPPPSPTPLPRFDPFAYKPWTYISASPTFSANSDNCDWSGSPAASLIPPPPIIFSTPPVASGLPLSVPSPVPFPVRMNHPFQQSPMEVDSSMGTQPHAPVYQAGHSNWQVNSRSCWSPDIPSLTSPQCEFGGGAQSQPQSQKANDVSVSSPLSSCCSITQGKQEIQTLLASFKSEFDRVMNATFGSTIDTFGSSANTASSSSPNPTVNMSGIPGAWPEVMPIVPEPVRACINMWCVQCGKLFGGPWYSCDKCSWHVLCTGCINGHSSEHEHSFGEGHVMNKRTCQGCPPELGARREFVPPLPSSPASTPTLANTDRQATPTPVAPAVHQSIVCDECGDTIVGIRHKCLDCPDFDLCTPCVETGSTERHNPFHEFFEIEKPGKVYVHNVYSGDGERNSGSNSRRSSTHVEGSAAQCAPRTASAPISPRPVGHHATCDLCDSRIRGDRYKCLNCPDFDTCSLCFNITPEQHPQHGFVKIHNNDDLMIRNGLAADVRHYATCDGCQKTIYGTRYKCMHPDCPDFDLCGSCEAHPIPIHPPTHPMLKMKTADTVIPTVYRVGQTQLINRNEGSRDDDRARPLPTPPMPMTSTVTINETPVSEVQITREQDHVMERNTSSLESSVAGFTLPPLTLDPRADLFREFWPRVTEELRLLPRSYNPTRTTHHEQDRNVSKPHGSDTSITIAVDPFRDPEPKQIKMESPDLSTQALLSRPINNVHASEMAQSTSNPTLFNISLATLLDNYRTPSPDFSAPLEASVSSMKGTPESEAAPSIPSSPALQAAQLVTALLKASFVSDTTVPDGQVFPPGAEFVKSWRMLNDGPTDWPESTELHYAAGETFSVDPRKIKVGKVAAGVQVDVWTGDLKAPDAAGNYRGYWRLSDGEGTYFGHSLWVDITVAEVSNQSDGSLASSSVIMMPQAPASALSTATRQHILSLTRESSGTATSKLSIDTASDGGSVGSSVSLISVPSSDDEDEADWQDSRVHLVASPPHNARDASEYIVLYDDASSDEE